MASPARTRKSKRYGPRTKASPSIGDAPVDASRMRNTVWDGHRVSLAAARNEIIAFQVIVEAGDHGIDGLTRLAAGAAIERRRCHSISGASKGPDADARPADSAVRSQLHARD